MKKVRDDADECLAQIADGGEAEEVDGGKLFRQSFFLESMRNPLGKFVIDERFFEMVRKVVRVRVVKDGSPGNGLDMAKQFGQVSSPQPRERN